jgi:hypothetical protein
MTSLPISQVHVDNGAQTRAQLDPVVISEYAEAMAEGTAFPPVTVFFDGSAHWLADGFHRVAAAHRVGLTVIPAEVRAGSRRDAVLFSAGANATHGLRRSNADKRCAVQIMLADAEWRTWSDREIARRCGVSQPFVGRIRAELDTDNGYQSSTLRIGGDGRTIDTAKIGVRDSEPLSAQERADFAECESRIQRGMMAALEVGKALIGMYTILGPERFRDWLREKYGGERDREFAFCMHVANEGLTQVDEILSAYVEMVLAPSGLL